MDTINSKLFNQEELVGKDMDITVDNLNDLIKSNFQKIKYFNKLLDIKDLVVNADIRYINIKKNNNKIAHGGKIISVTKKDKKGKDDYLILFKSSFGPEIKLLYSKVVIFYKTQTVEQLRKNKYEEWKETMKKEKPDEFKKWQEEKELKDKIRNEDIDLYKAKYQHYRKSKK